MSEFLERKLSYDPSAPVHEHYQRIADQIFENKIDAIRIEARCKTSVNIESYRKPEVESPFKAAGCILIGTSAHKQDSSNTTCGAQEVSVIQSKAINLNSNPRDQNGRKPTLSNLGGDVFRVVDINPTKLRQFCKVSSQPRVVYR